MKKKDLLLEIDRLKHHIQKKDFNDDFYEVLQLLKKHGSLHWEMDRPFHEDIDIDFLETNYTITLCRYKNEN